MEKGQVKMEELVKVIDHMKTLSREDLIKKMLDSPAKKMEKMKTAWSRLLTEINSSFMLDAFTAVFETMATEIKKATEWMKENKEEIKLWVNRVKHIVGALWELKEVLLALYITNKLFKAGGIAGGLWGWLTRVPVLPPAPLSVRIVNFLKSGLRMALRAWPAVAAAFIYDLVETLQGKSTILSGWIESDNGFVSALAKLPVLMGETIKNLSLGAAVGVGWLYNLLFGNEEELRIAESKLTFWFTDLMQTMDKYRILPDSWSMVMLDTLDPMIERLKVIYYLMKSVAVIDLVNPIDSWGDSKEAFAEAMRISKGIARSSQDSEAKTPLLPKLPPTSAVGARSYPPVPFFMSPKAQQGVTSPTFNLTINATGTPEDVKRIASETFADQLQSVMYGTIANFQAGQ